MSDASQRSAIVEISLEKFRKYGIRRVTIDEIARELRISKKTFYQHFPDKEALVRACMERNVEQILPEVAAVLDGTGASPERMMRVWGVLSKIPRLVTVELMGDLKADYPHLWEEIDRRRHTIIGRVEAGLERGIASGEIRPEINPKVVVRMLTAIMERVITPDVLTLGEFAPADVFTTIVTIVTRGMFVRSPASPAKEQET